MELEFLEAKIIRKKHALKSMIAEYKKKLVEKAFIPSMVPMYEGLVEKYEYALDILEDLLPEEK